MPASTAEVSKSPESFILNSHKKFLKETHPSPSLLALNESGINGFERLKFPHKKHEMYTFLSTKELAATPFRLHPGGSPVEKDFVMGHVYKGCEESYVTLVDGEYRAGLSNTSALGASLKIMGIDEAVADPAIEKYFRESIEKENDVFAAINSAFLNKCLALRVSAKAHFDVPLQILHVSTGSTSEPVTTVPRVLINVETLGEIKIIAKYVGLNDRYFVNSVLDFLLAQGAGVAFTQVQADAKDAWHFSKTRVVLHRDSRFTAVNASSGSKLTRHHYEIHLKETGAEARLNGVNILVDKEQVHYYVRVSHEAPRCASNMHFKNIVNDHSRCSIDGTVIVQKDAQLTQSDQLINNLVLSDDAHADSKPILMINADDVKCTHGNTVGQIDEEQLFYLKTRGLSGKTAKTLLTRGFAASIVETMEFPSVREDLEKTLLKKLEANHG